MTIYDHIQEAAAFIRSQTDQRPDTAVILGSGLGDFADSLEDKTAIAYETIPHFKPARVAGHAGKLVIGRTGGAVIAAMQGRYHYYEGHDIRDVVFPVRALCGLGVRKILLTNAAGGINPMLEAGDLMIISDHLHLLGAHPLRGENDDRIGPRFPDMSQVYDSELSNIIAQAMRNLGLGVKKGVYASLSGPSYETPAEIRMLATLGADAVGMSTTHEAISARHMNARVAAISCVSNLAAGISKKPLSHQEVTETANRVKSTFISLLNAILPQFAALR